MGTYTPTCTHTEHSTTLIHHNHLQWNIEMEIDKVNWKKIDAYGQEISVNNWKEQDIIFFPKVF